MVVLLFGAGDRLHQRLHRRATKLPSFIVTLATFFILQGVNVGGTLKLTGTVSDQRHRQRAPGFDSARPIFAATVWSPYDFQVTVLWWIAHHRARDLGAGAHPLRQLDLRASAATRTPARNVGVPVARTKITLFMTTSIVGLRCVGIITALQLRSMQANEGVGQRVHLHHRRGRRRLPADRRLRLGDRRRASAR